MTAKGVRLQKTLLINIDHVATLRQARGGVEPDPVTAAAICELAGADGIVVHLREDRRHIQDRDLYLLRRTVKTKIDLEMANTEQIVNLALEVKPELVTLVPEKRQELTTEGGLDVCLHAVGLRKSVEQFKTAGTKVSFFIDPEEPQVRKAAEIGADCIEIHTGRYCDAENEMQREKELKRIRDIASLAYGIGLQVNAGHGINYINIKSLREIPEITEFSIGHAIISRAVLVGLDRAVREMAALVNV